MVRLFAIDTQLLDNIIKGIFCNYYIIIIVKRIDIITTFSLILSNYL